MLNVVEVIGFPDEKSLLKDFMEHLENATLFQPSDILAGIIFDFPNSQTLPHNITYKIRLSSTPRNRNHTGQQEAFFQKDNGWKTQQMFPLLPMVGPRETNETWGGSPGMMNN